MARFSTEIRFTRTLVSVFTNHRHHHMKMMCKQWNPGRSKSDLCENFTMLHFSIMLSDVMMRSYHVSVFKLKARTDSHCRNPHN
jgi:hypothetical protein